MHAYQTWDSLFNNGVRKTEYLYAQELNQTLILHQAKKKESSQNVPKDLNVRPETIKLPTRKQQKLHGIDLSNDFFDMPQKVHTTKIYKWKYIKLYMYILNIYMYIVYKHIYS